MRVRDLHADGGFPGDGGHDADTPCGELQRDVVLEVHDAADLHAAGGDQFIQRDHRSRGDAHAFQFDIELQEGLAEEFGIGLQFGLVHIFLPRLRCIQKFHRRDTRTRSLPPSATCAGTAAPSAVGFRVRVGTFVLMVSTRRGITGIAVHHPAGALVLPAVCA